MRAALVLWILLLIVVNFILTGCNEGPVYDNYIVYVDDTYCRGGDYPESIDGGLPNGGDREVCDNAIQGQIDLESRVNRCVVVQAAAFPDNRWYSAQFWNIDSFEVGTVRTHESTLAGLEAVAAVFYLREGGDHPTVCLDFDVQTPCDGRCILKYMDMDAQPFVPGDIKFDFVLPNGRCVASGELAQGVCQPL